MSSSVQYLQDKVTAAQQGAQGADAQTSMLAAGDLLHSMVVPQPLATAVPQRGVTIKYPQVAAGVF